MRKAYRYRLSPTKSQATLLKQTLEMCRWVYNDTLALRKNAWEQEQHSISLYETNKILTQWKKERPDLKGVHSQVLQNVQMRVDLAFKAFFQRVKAGENPGYPRFKGKGRYDSITYPQYGFKFNGDHLHLSKIGDVKFVLHRPVEGTIKTLTIRRSSTGKWYACFSVEYESSPLPQKETVVGIDVGLNSFTVDSDGAAVENPRFYEHSQDKIKKIQQSIARKKRFSQNWKKAKSRLEKVYDHVTNQKKDFLHKLSRQYVDTYATICVEDLNIKGLKEKGNSTGLHTSIHDASWGRFYSYLAYKAESAGTKLVKVDPRNTSQICSNCGSIVKKSISERVHECPYCGFVADRDYNAAVNIHRVGMEQPFEPVEMIPLHHIAVMQVLSMKQEATPNRAW